MDPLEARRLLGGWRHGRGPLYVELAHALASLIDAGHMEPGAVLPAERKLADELAVSRNTVVAAYSTLRESGRVRTRRGSGSVVAGRDALSPRATRISGSLTPNSVFDGFLSPRDDAIDLRAAYWIGTDDIPQDVFEVVSDPRYARLLADSGYFPQGVPELRSAIAERLTGLGLPTDADEVLITTGAQQALALVVSLLVDPGDPVVVEDPTYPGAIDLFRAYGAHVHALRRDDHGPDPYDLRRVGRRLGPRLVYLVLTGHNPTGTISPEPVRHTIAREVDQGLVVVDDVSLGDTVADPPPPLAAFVSPDARGHAVTVGSLSKTAWGGLRIGWLRASGGLVQRLTHVKTIHDIGTPALSQLHAIRLLERLDAFLPDRHDAIRGRRTRLEKLLRTAVPGWRWETPEAGLCLWVDLGDTNGVDFAAHASRFGVELAPGTISSPLGGHADRLRVPFGQPDHVLTEAVSRIGAAWSAYDQRGNERDRLRLVM